MSQDLGDEDESRCWQNGPTRVEKEDGRSRSRTGESGGLSRGWAQGTGAKMDGVSGTVRGERGERGEWESGQWYRRLGRVVRPGLGMERLY